MFQIEELTNTIKVEVKNLGFFACGIAKAEAVDDRTSQAVRQWLSNGSNADMSYMANHTDKRLDPRLLMPGVKSIVSVAMNYKPQQRIPEDQYQIASYAYGQDYHDVVKNKLRTLANKLNFIPYPETESINFSAEQGKIYYRVFCDSAPILERYWAVKAGLGWTGRNHQLIIPRGGSMFVLGEIFLTVPLLYDREMPNYCDNCYKCVEACPTKALGDAMEQRCNDALSKDVALHNFHAALCLSYQTIENRNELSKEVRKAMGNSIYGCDICQTVCPWNRNTPATNVTELYPKTTLLSMTREKWHNLTEEEYRQLFKGSAVKRAKYSGLKRNIDSRRGE